MTQRPFSFRRTLIAAASVLALPGCISILPTGEPAKALYRLEPIPSGQVPPLMLDVVISEPEAARSISGVDIVVVGPDGGLRFLQDYKWSDAATRLIQLGTISALAGSGGPGIAVATEEGARTDLELRWRLEDFAIYSGPGRPQAVCTISLTVLDARTRRPLAQRTETRRIGVSDNDLSRIQGLQQAASEAALAAAQFVSKTAMKRSQSEQAAPALTEG